MKRYAAAVVLLAFVPLLAWADVPLEIHGGGKKIVQVDKVVVIKEDRTVVTKLPFVIVAPAGAFDYKWSIPNGVQGLDKGDCYEVTVAPKGDLTFSVIIKNFIFEEKRWTQDFKQITFSIGDVGPQPVPPGPVPPGPVPPVPPAPLPDKGLRVLFVYEREDWGKYPPAVVNAMSSQKVYDYLSAKCVKVNNQPEWRVLDKDDNTANMSPIWQAAMKKPRTSLPWVLISDGVIGFEGAMPESEQALLDLLKRFGGQ